MHTPKPAIFRVVLLLITILVTATLYGTTYTKAHADMPDLSASNLLTVSASWNANTLQNNATSSIPLNTPGTFSWKIDYDASSTDLKSYLPKIANAIYTIQLYRGSIGDSFLLYQETVPNGTATSSGSFDFTFPGSGKYFLTYTATYPDDTYPIGEGPSSCKGDLCILPAYSLADFQEFVTNGVTEDPGRYGHFIPALYGLNQFVITAPPGPNSSNVLFLPGIMESRLYMQDANGHEKLIWEPTRNSDMSLLAMNKDGKSENAIYTRDIIDNLYSKTPALSLIAYGLSKSAAILYGPFETFMDSLVSEGFIKQWQAYPYDWRYGADEIVRNGTLVADSSGTTTRVRLQDVVQSLASSSPTGKVTIIVHSNGGLIAKALAVDLEKSDELRLIDKIIMVGTPQIGTPMAIGDLLHGDDQTRVLGLVTSGDTMRQQALTMPGVYGLLPSPEYSQIIASPVATFGSDDLLRPYVNAYGNSITASSSLYNFLTDSAHIHDGYSPSDLRTPAQLTPSILDNAWKTHASTDLWVPPDSLSLVSITGIGQSTVSGYSYSTRVDSSQCSILSKIRFQCKKQPTLSHEPLITSEGDDTVVFLSAAINPGVRMYFDSQAFQQITGQSIGHQSLLSANPVQEQIRDVIDDASRTGPYISLATPPTLLIPDDTLVSMHSPMNLLVTDSAGRQSGVVPLPGTDFSVTKEDIPGSSVQTVDDEKYVYIPRQNSYSVALNGSGTGLTTVEIGRTASDGSIQTLQTFADIPTTASTTGTFSIDAGVASTISVDVDGDGVTDLEASTSESSNPATTTATMSTDMPRRIGSGSGTSGGEKRAGQSRRATSLATPAVRLMTYPDLLHLLLQLKLRLLELLQNWARARNIVQ